MKSLKPSHDQSLSSRPGLHHRSLFHLWAPFGPRSSPSLCVVPHEEEEEVDLCGAGLGSGGV